MFAALTILMSSVPAHATDIDTQPFLLSTEVEAWPVTDLDSGWWPEEGPVRVRTVLFAEGIARIDIGGDSVVEGDSTEATHTLDSASAEGVAGIELNIDASLYLSLDVAGYTWEDVLHQEEVDFDVSQEFQSFAFAEDGGVELSMPMDPVEVFQVDQAIFPLVDVVVTGTLSPDAALAITTESIDTDDGSFTAEGQSLATTGGQIELDAQGTLTSQLNTVLQGHAEVCITWVDCYGDFTYDFDLDPLIQSQELVYDSATIEHAAFAGGGDTAGSSDEVDKSTVTATGGCSAVPVTEPSSVWVVLLMAALACRRRAH